MADQSEARVDNMSAPASRDPAAPGLRGERSPIRPQRPDPDLSHQIRLDSGRTVVVREGSGTTFAESTGRAGLAGGRPWLDPAAYEEEPGSRIRLPLLVGLGVAAAVVGVAKWRSRSNRQGKPMPLARVAPHDDIGQGVGGRHVGHQSAIGLAPARTMHNQGPVHFQSAR